MPARIQGYRVNHGMRVSRSVWRRQGRLVKNIHGQYVRIGRMMLKIRYNI